MFEKASLAQHDGKFYGEYRARVLDNKDPKMLGRLKVEIPSVYGEGIESPWCFCKSPFAGKTYGFYMIPSIGDYVWVTFEQGGSDYPVWNGSPYTTDVPEDITKTKDGEERKLPNVYMIKTPLKSAVVMDDNPKAPRLQINTPSGTSILLDDTPDKSMIKIYHFSGSTITMQTDGSIHITPKKDQPTYIESNVITKDITCENIISSKNVTIAGNLTAKGIVNLG